MVYDDKLTVGRTQEAQTCEASVPWHVNIEEVCGAPAETVDFVNGFRCAQHPPEWNTEYAQRCVEQRRPGAAAAYARTMNALREQREGPKEEPVGRRALPIEHGTLKGYRAHYRKHEPMCDACRAAAGHKPMTLAPCGTRAAYNRHLRYGEKCEECCRANTADSLRRRKQRKPPPEGDPRHGTLNAYGNHNCRCGPCVAVNSAKTAARTARIRSEAA